MHGNMQWRRFDLEIGGDGDINKYILSFYQNYCYTSLASLLNSTPLVTWGRCPPGNLTRIMQVPV